MDKCVICSNVFNRSDKIYGTKCSHLFHYDCLQFYLKRSGTCPECNEKVLQTDIGEVELVFEAPKVAQDKSRKREVLGGERSERQNEYRTSNRGMIDASDDRRANRRLVSRVNDLRNDHRANRRMNSYPYDESRKPKEITNIYNESGTVIVCNTYEPRTINYFGSNLGSSEAGMMMSAMQIPWDFLKKIFNSIFSGNGIIYNK